MKAFVLAGGLGTRLKGRFGDLPKPLAPLGGRPFLATQLEWLAAHGVRDAVLLVGYGAAAVRDALGAEAHGVRIAYSIEDEPLGTGGALRLAMAEVRGAALVVNGDTIGDADPWALERARWERGAIGAVALYRVDDAASRGRVEVGTDGRVTRFVEKDADWRGPAWVNGGQYVFAPRFWRELPPGPHSLERDVLPKLAARGQLVGATCEGRFWDIGTPEEFDRAEREIGR